MRTAILIETLARCLAFSGILVLCIESARAGQSSTESKTPRPPNILFVIADDWGLHAGAYGTRWVHTPTFDRIAHEGSLFLNAFTPVAKCAPSRAILLTGRHAWQNEEAGNHMAYFPAKLKTWPEVLMENGWNVGITGKGWGPGIANDNAGKPRQLTGQPWNRHKLKPPATGIAANDYAANFKEFLSKAPADQPWCFWCGMLEPHRNYEYQSGVNKGHKSLTDIDRVPGYWPDEDTVRHDLLDYAYEVEHCDRQLADMLAALESRGLFEETVVIVTSDHGMPFPRVKGYAYHDSNHVPLAIRWPRPVDSSASVKPCQVIAEFVDFTDIAPTVLQLANIAPEDSGMLPITGESLIPLIDSGACLKARDHVLVGKERTDVGRPGDVGYPIRGIVTAEYLYLKNYEPSRWPAGNPETGYLDTDGSPTKTRILELGRQNRRDKFWRLNFGMRPAEELYDLTTDRDCTTNLAASPSMQGVREQLRSRMENELRSHKDPRMEGNGEIFDLYPPTNGAGFYEKHKSGQPVEAGWVNPSDFEPAEIPSER